MKDRRDRLGQMTGGSAANAAPAARAPNAARPEAALRKRALLFAPPPVPSGAYVSLLESEGFDVLVAQDPQAAETLLRSAPPKLILAVAPTLGPEVVQSWGELAPQAEVRLIPSLVKLLEERLVPAKQLLEFTIKVLSIVSGIASTTRGIPGNRTSRILNLAEKAAESLGFSERDLISTRLSAVLGGAAEALHLDGSSPGEEGPTVTLAFSNRRNLLADFAEAVGCPFPVGIAPPSDPPSSRSPVPAEVVDAALRLALLHEENDPNPPLALRCLGMEDDSAAQQLHPAAVEAVLAASSERAGQGRAEILLVDSDANARNLLALRLGNEGYSARTANDGRRALEEIRRQPPGLVLSEAVLAGLDGYALLDALKREGKGNIPFMFLSERADPLSVNKGLLLGATDFLTKPVNFEVLLTKLQKALSQEVDLSEVSARLSLSDVTKTGAVDFPLVSYDELKPGATVMARFRVDAALGEGGMGKVFKAWDEKLEEQVVLKVMKPGFSDDVLRRFKREIRLARKITHPGVVRIFDFWEAGQLKFVTMEYLEGSDLRVERKKRGIFPVPVALRVASEIFEALSAAHEVGVVHRDMKPHNVAMLPTGKIKVLDFGIAQGLESHGPEGMTTTTSIIGTPEYMSPEQILGEKLDVRTDIYSTGILVYELLAGELPFRGPDRVTSARMRLTAEPLPPSALNPHIRPEVDTLCLRMLKRDREERYSSTQSVLADLTRLRNQ